MHVRIRIYFDKVTGQVVQRTGGFFDSGLTEEPSEAYERTVYNSLVERVPESVGMIQLEQGQYDDDFARSTSYRVNPITLQLEFPDPNAPDEPPVYQKPLSEKVAELKAENSDLRQQLASTNADLVGFQSFIFEKFPELA